MFYVNSIEHLTKKILVEQYQSTIKNTPMQVWVGTLRYMSVLLQLNLQVCDFFWHAIAKDRKYLQVTIRFPWCEGHWNRKEISRMSCNAKLHTTTLVWWIYYWQLPLKNRMLVIIVVLPIHFSYNWSTNTVPATTPNKAFWLK